LVTRAVLNALQDLAEDGEHVTVAMEQIADELGICRTTVHRAISDLRRDGVLHRVVRGGGHVPASTYVLRPGALNCGTIPHFTRST
jgi:biotin operon repressor